MTGILKDVYLYRGSEVNDNFANYLIDEVYQTKKLYPINIENNNSDKSIENSKKTVISHL